MPSRVWATLTSLGVGVLSLLRVALVYDRLPERMASHYGASGQPNGFMPRDEFFIFYFGIFVIVIGMFLAMPGLLRTVPRELVNIPHREYWLTDENWPEALERMGRWMSWFGAAMAIFAAAVLHLVIRSNLHQAPLSNNAMFVLLGALFAFTIYWLIGLFRAFRPPE